MTSLTNKNAAVAAAAMTQKVSKHPMSTSSIPAAPTRRGDPDTSYEAAETVNPARMQLLTLQALRSLSSKRQGPFNAWEVEHEAVQIISHRLSDSTIRSRLPEMVRKGQVVRVDRKGISPSGNACYRYALAEMGVAA